jgi:hypothetical protein
LPYVPPELKLRFRFEDTRLVRQQEPQPANEAVHAVQQKELKQGLLDSASAAARPIEDSNNMVQTVTVKKDVRMTLFIYIAPVSHSAIVF